jgi:hypothetical protein
MNDRHRDREHAWRVAIQMNPRCADALDCRAALAVTGRLEP